MPALPTGSERLALSSSACMKEHLSKSSRWNHSSKTSKIASTRRRRADNHRPFVHSETKSLETPRTLRWLGDVLYHPSHGLLLRLESDIRLRDDADQTVLVVDDGYASYLMACHHLQSV